MPTTPSRSLALLALLVCLCGVAGCSERAGEAGAPAAAQSGSAVPEAVPTATFTAPPDVLAGLTGALDRRAAAVRDGDARTFLAGLVSGDRSLRGQQRTYYDNVRQLPLAAFAYELEPTGLLREGDDYLAVVDLRLQLGGYDALPVLSRDRFRFTPADQPGQFEVAAATDPEWLAGNKIGQQPWDTAPVVVRSVPGVLGIFDSASASIADRLLADVQRGLTDVSATVPVEWSRSVVVYALSDPTYLASIPDLPGGDPRTLDGVAFPVTAEPEGVELASTRFVLAPRMLTRADGARDRLIRHELTHVAIGAGDDHAPVWLSEGLAEYVSVRPLPPEKRGISQSALDAAKVGFADLPADAAFNDVDSRVHYGESWWACEYVAANFGEPTLWSLLTQLNDPELDAKEQDAVLRTWIGLGSRQLAHRASKLLVATFEPPVVVPPVPDPATVPDTVPTGTPTPVG